jgi:hypothetical protein
MENKNKRNTIWAVMAMIIVIGAGYVFYKAYYSVGFKSSFEVSIPWFMDQDERELLQPFVTKQIQGRAKQVDVIRRTTCDDPTCMQKKLADFQTAKYALDCAVNSANHFDFDASGQVAPPTSSQR